MTDIEKRSGTCAIAHTESGMAVLTGSAPVASMGDYQTEVTSYTKGCGKLTCTMKGYEPCHNTEEVVERIGYDPERDTDHPAGSVFCAHGAGFVVGWDHVKEYMHVDSGILKELPEGMDQPDGAWGGRGARESWPVGCKRRERTCQDHAGGFRPGGDMAGYRRNRRHIKQDLLCQQPGQGAPEKRDTGKGRQPQEL